MNAGPNGSTQERAPPAGQPTRELVGRETVVCVRYPRNIFLRGWSTRAGLTGALHGAGVFLVLPPKWLDFDCAVSEVVATIALLFFYALSLCSLVARLIGFLALGIPQSSKATIRLAPLPLLLRLPMQMDDLVSILSRRCTLTYIRLFRYFGVTCAGKVLTRSGCSTRLNVLLHVPNFAPS